MMRLSAIPVMLLAFTVAAQEAEEKTTASPDSNQPILAAAEKAESVGWLQGKIESLEERMNASESLTAFLNGLKLSGYVQGRFQYNQNSKDTSVTDGFSVRRGRFKVEYKTTWGGFVLQTDATGKGVTLKDAEAHLKTPWTGDNWNLVIGQTKWPFGYEIVQSSADREMPERTRVIQAFGPGERDRGAKLLGKYKFLRLAVGVFDGNGTGNVDPWTAKAISGVDNDPNKDVVGRIGVDFGWIAAGVSGWTGKTYRPDNATTTDINEAKTFTRDRLGADVQLYLDFLPFGATAIKGEYITGHTWQKSGVEQFGVPADGYYALLVQNIGLKNAVVVRFDRFNPNAGGSNKADPSNPTKPASSNAINTIGFGVVHYWDEVLKISLAFEIPLIATASGTKDPADDLLTLQLQAKF